VITLSAAHYRARKVLPNSCTLADETCKGRLEVALRKDAPPGMLRVESGLRYFIGDEPLDGYIRLCTSHHRRYDGSMNISPEAAARGQVSGGRAATEIRRLRGDYETPEWKAKLAAARIAQAVAGWPGQARGRATQKAAGHPNLTYGLHIRWHVNREIANPKCDLCQGGEQVVG
jgi:hypothetical protein